MRSSEFADKFKDKLGQFAGWCFLSGMLGMIALMGLGPWWIVVMILRYWPQQ